MDVGHGSRPPIAFGEGEFGPLHRDRLAASTCRTSRPMSSHPQPIGLKAPPATSGRGCSAWAARPASGATGSPGTHPPGSPCVTRRPSRMPPPSADAVDAKPVPLLKGVQPPLRAGGVLGPCLRHLGPGRERHQRPQLHLQLLLLLPQRPVRLLEPVDGLRRLGVRIELGLTLAFASFALRSSTSRRNALT